MQQAPKLIQARLHACVGARTTHTDARTALWHLAAHRIASHRTRTHAQDNDKNPHYDPRMRVKNVDRKKRKWSFVRPCMPALTH